MILFPIEKNQSFRFDLYKQLFYADYSTKLKGMTLDHDFGYSFPLLSSLLKKDGRRNGEWISKNRDQKSCFSARLFKKNYMNLQ